MDERVALLRLRLTEGIGSGRLRSLLAKFGTAAKAWNNRHMWHSVRGLSASLADKAGRVDEAAVERQLRAMDEVGARIVAYGRPDYPAGLLHVTHPPGIVFARGHLPVDYKTCVAIVGTRRATRNGLELARTIARDLAALGITIVSGLARGIDGAAHRGALEADGRTVAVLGCGLDVAYPPEHRSLLEQIAAEGGVVTEYLMGTSPEAHHFPARNRIIAGLATGVLLIESGGSGGALHTVNYALDYGRDVMAVPGDVHRWHSQGPNQLIREGAALIRNAADVLDALGWTSIPKDGLEARKEAAAVGTGFPEPVAGPSSGRSVGDAGARLVAHLRMSGPLSIDELAHDLGMPVDEVAASLTWMELLGRIRREAGGRYTAFR